jgi:hypothetical protein
MADDYIVHIQRSVEVGDFVLFSSKSSNSNGLGEVIHSTVTTVKVKIIHEMDSTTLQTFTIPPINAMDYPLAFYV